MSNKCKKSWWRLSRNNKSNQPYKLPSKKRNSKRSMRAISFKRSKVRSWRVRIRTWVRRSLTLKSAIGSSPKRSTQSRFTRECSSMPWACSASSAQSSFRARRSSTMSNNALRIAQASAVYSSKFRFRYLLPALGWCKMKLTIGPTLITWSKSSSMGSNGK